MTRSLRTGALVMGLVGSILGLIVSFIMYNIVASKGYVLIAVAILIGGILGGLVGIIGTAYMKTKRLFVPIMQLVAFILILVGGVAMIIYSTLPSTDPNTALAILPLIFVPDLLVGVAGVFTLASQKEEAKESKLN